MGAAARLACAALVMLAIAAPLPAIAGSQPAQAAPAEAGHASAAPTAEFSLGGLFGDENEPDENEPDEGSQQTTQSGGSGVSWTVVILLVAAAGTLGGIVYLRIRRLVLRARAWGRDLWARL
jgi:hypothetical protein